jgi:hypothetical protein
MNTATSRKSQASGVLGESLTKDVVRNKRREKRATEKLHKVFETRYKNAIKDEDTTGNAVEWNKAFLEVYLTLNHLCDPFTDQGEFPDSFTQLAQAVQTIRNVQLLSATQIGDMYRFGGHRAEVLHSIFGSDCAQGDPIVSRTRTLELSEQYANTVAMVSCLSCQVQTS